MKEKMSTDFQTRNFRLYGPQISLQIENVLQPLGIDSVEKLHKTGYKDALILSRDFETKRAVALNNDGQVLDNRGRIITHTGNGVYHTQQQQREPTEQSQRQRKSTQQLQPQHKKKTRHARGMRGGQQYDKNETIKQNSAKRGPTNDEVSLVEHYIVDENGLEYNTDHNGKRVQEQGNGKQVSESKEQLVPMKSVPMNNRLNLLDRSLLSRRKEIINDADTQEATVDYVTGVLADHDLIKSLKLIQENYICPGIHLYYFQWNSAAKKEFNCSGFQYGLLNEEVHHYYPELFKNTDDNCTISITTTESQQNHTLAKIYFLFKNPEWLDQHMHENEI